VIRKQAVELENNSKRKKIELNKDALSTQKVKSLNGFISVFCELIGLQTSQEAQKNEYTEDGEYFQSSQGRYIRKIFVKLLCSKITREVETFQVLF